jgi:uncharacterized protein (TIGR03435 family)
VKTALLAIVATASMTAQTSPPTAPATRFDVVSVKRNRSGDTNASLRPTPGGGLIITNNTLRGLVRNAYFLPDDQIVGGPEWFDTDRFDIIATGSGLEVALPIMVTKLKALLTDRFGLQAHSEMRERSVYLLVPTRVGGPLGPQLRLSTVDCRPAAGVRPAGVVPPGQPAGEQPVCGSRNRRGLMMMGGGGMADFARELTPRAGRIVVDGTGLAGTFDLTLTWDAEVATGAIETGVSIFTAMQEQLGLKLEPQRAPVEVLVIDRAEPPTEN